MQKVGQKWIVSVRGVLGEYCIVRLTEKTISLMPVIQNTGIMAGSSHTLFRPLEIFLQDDTGLDFIEDITNL